MLHDHPAPPTLPVSSADRTRSPFAASAGHRLALAGGAAALLWLAVGWALSWL